MLYGAPLLYSFPLRSVNKILGTPVLPFSKSNNVNSMPPANYKTLCKHTAKLKMHFFISAKEAENMEMICIHRHVATKLQALLHTCISRLNILFSRKKI